MQAIGTASWINELGGMVYYRVIVEILWLEMFFDAGEPFHQGFLNRFTLAK